MMKMRRSDRQVSDSEELRGIIQRCTVCHLALCSEDGPYVVPLNFGYDYDGERLTLYFHSANEGRKLDLIGKNPLCGFEMDCHGEVRPAEAACDFSMDFESLIGNGRISICEGEYKVHALRRIMAHYSERDDFSFPESELKVTAVMRLDVTGFTGKRIAR